MRNSAPRSRSLLQSLAALLGVALLVYLVERAGPGRLLENARTIGWGIVLVIALAGLVHVIKTWAWRLTLPGQAHKVSFSRTLGLRLASEAIGQFGLIGQMFGDGLRVSLLGSGVPVASGISSVTLDRGLFIATGALVTIAGLLAATVVVSLSGVLRLYAWVFVIVLLGLLASVVIAFRKGWPLVSGTARAAGRVPWFREWLKSKESVIESAEHQLLKFHREAPRAFWASLLLNILCHMLAIAEVYLILRFLGARVSLVGALILESMTKLINVIGAVNPGNLGTYEGGNMAIGKLVGLTATEGLTLGLCRRFRAIFWAILGGICLAWFSRSDRRAGERGEANDPMEEREMSTQEQTPEGNQLQSYAQVAIVLANADGDEVPTPSVLAPVGALPLALRAILSAKSAGADRIIVAVGPVNGPAIRRRLASTRRLPDSVEWLEVLPESAVSTAVQRAAANAERVVLIRGDRSYHPSLYRTAGEWDGDGALELVSDGALVGLTALSRDLALDLVRDSSSKIASIEALHEWIRRRHAAKFGPTVVYCKTVAQDSWQKIASEQDCLLAEKKLESWLVKPTDGVFARMNRRVSIPISRQLIKFPITPNMVSLFTLGVSFASGLYFGLGGYWNALIGAVLSVWASILDGCDGEVARLKLQASDFGCWLDTVCDYLYYIFIFVGMTVGLVRSTGKTSYLTWGGMLLLGAIATFVMASIGRKRLSGQRPEQYLAEWQKKAESQKSNPLAYIGRHLEFIIRRCFLPYALLAFALLNLTWIPICVGAVGANLAWIISAYSVITFSPKEAKSSTLSASSAAAASL